MFTKDNSVAGLFGEGSGFLNICDVLNRTVQLFKTAELDNPRLDAELLLSYVICCQKIDLYVNHDRKLDEQESFKFKKLVEMRLDRVPIQYILGKTEFMSLDFFVDRHVLIPRPETELIVEAVLDIVAISVMDKDCKRAQSCFSVLKKSDLPLNLEIDDAFAVVDLGTGSGNIAVSIAVLLESAVIYACDISVEALNVARRNAEYHNVFDRIKFLHSDLFDTIRTEEPDLKADFIVSNPPYIAESELDSLQTEVQKYEPLQALISGKDGLVLLKTIIYESKNWLKINGYLIIEIGENQLDDIKNILYSSSEGNSKSGTKIVFVKSLKDLQGIDRVVIAQNIMC